MKRRTIKALLTLFILALAFIPWNVIGAQEESAPGQGTEESAPGQGTKAADMDKMAEEEERPELSADAAFLSQYVWRGYGLSEDSLVIQPSVTAAYKGFALNLWGNLDTDYEPQQGSKWNETDMTVSYGHSFGIVGLEAGFIYYALDGLQDSKEFYLSAGVDTLLEPTITVYREISKLAGWYINLGISHSFALPYEMSLDLAGYVSYYKSDNDNMVEYNSDGTTNGDRYDGLHDGLVSVGLAIPFWKYFTVTPSIAYAFPLSHAADNELQALSLDNKANHLVGGVTFSMAF